MPARYEMASFSLDLIPSRGKGILPEEHMEHIYRICHGL